MAAKAKGRFIDPMLLLRTDSLPNDGDRWEYQLKFDGYRAIAFKTGSDILPDNTLSASEQAQPA